MKASKETMKEVKKVWGKEEWIVNCPLYCGKLLYLDKGAVSSLHYHPKKRETFFALSGQTALTIEGKDYMLNPASRPKTIYPKQKHQFSGLSEGIVILEISTHHEEGDVVRLTESQPALKLTSPVKIAFISKAGVKVRKPSGRMTKPVKVSFLARQGDIKKRVRLTDSQPKQ